MAGEIQCRPRPRLTGATLYAQVRTATGTIWNGASFETYSTANIGTYDITMTEQGTASGYYAGAFPTVSSGVYGIVVFQQAGGAPAETDESVAQGDVEWDGSAIVPLSSKLGPTVAGRTLDVSTGGEAGIDWANIGSATTAQNLSATNIDVDQVVASVSGAVGSVTGNVDGNVTGTIGGLTAVALKDFFDTDSTTTYASAVAGSVVKEIADNAGGGAPTAAQIATAVWQDSTAGDFTVASSIGKALYINNVAPGGSGGHLISGSNAGTTTLGALTVTNAFTVSGATVHTGNVSMAAGLTITQSIVGGHAITATGNDTGSGLYVKGGTLAPGLQVDGGSGSIHAALIQTTGGTGTGLLIVGYHGMTIAGDGGNGLTLTAPTGISLTCSTATFSGAVILSSTLTVSGTTSLAAVTTSGTVTFNTFTVTNAFLVSGATTFTGAVTAINASNDIRGVTVSAIGANVITAASIATDAVTEIQTGLATAAALALVQSDVDAIQIQTAQLTFTVSGNLDTNVQYVNDVQVTGTGAVGNEWGPA